VDSPTSSPGDALPRCTATRRDGTTCKGKRLPGKTVCVFHDPELAQRRTEGRKAGGKRRKKQPAVLPATGDLPCNTIGDIASLLGKAINEVRGGRLDPKVANSVAYLTTVLLKALEGGELEAKLFHFQRQIEEVKAYDNRRPHTLGRAANGTAGGPEHPGGKAGPGPPAGGPDAHPERRGDEPGPLTDGPDALFA